MSKTRMHEVLVKPGERPLETGEIFTVKNYRCNFHIDENGNIISGAGSIANYIVFDAISRGITRLPRYTAEQIEILKALWALGYKWIYQQGGDSIICASKKKPLFDKSGYLSSYFDFSCSSPCELFTLPGPLSIAQALKDAGVEVEG